MNWDRIGLGDHIGEYLKTIVPPLLNGMRDGDGKTRYYACESMYNVVSAALRTDHSTKKPELMPLGSQMKVAGGEILQWFNLLFDEISKVSIPPSATSPR